MKIADCENTELLKQVESGKAKLSASPIKKRKLESIAFKLRDGFWGMVQESLKEESGFDLYITHEDHGPWVHCYGVLGSMYGKRLQVAIEMFIGQADEYIEAYKETYMH